MIKVNEKQFVTVCLKSNSMAEAAAELQLHFNTFKKYALKFGCYNTNQSGKGTLKTRTVGVIPLDEILDGKHPSYQTFKLKTRLLKSGIKKNKCDECGVIEWRGKPLSIELEHIDGNRTNHLRSNLKMLCPNCHSQTLTFRAKNIR